jgi:uncharacterized protein affecting Mg2+/Co2+ transport
MIHNATSNLSSLALLWGRDHESQARLEYAQTLEEGWSIQESGLHVSTVKGKGCMGASPDAKVEERFWGVVPIQC